MNQPKGKIVVELNSRDPNYLSDKYMKELQKDIPFDMELVSSGAACKKVQVHRFVVMMFSKYIRNIFKDGGNSFKNGHVIIPVNVPYHTLLKVIDLFYDCHTTIPANGALAMMAALKSLQVDSVKDFMGPMGPPITAPYPGARPTPVDVQATSQFSRRQTMSYIQPINELKRPRSNMGQTPPPQMIRSFVAPLKVQASTLEPGRANQVQQQMGFRSTPVPAARNVGMVPITHGDNGSVSAPVSDFGKDKLSNESNKSLVTKSEYPNEGDSNKENECPDLMLDIDISNDETFKDMMANFENDTELNF